MISSFPPLKLVVPYRDKSHFLSCDRFEPVNTLNSHAFAVTGACLTEG